MKKRLSIISAVGFMLLAGVNVHSAAYIINTLPATGVSTNSAVLRGSVEIPGGPYDIRFEVGTSPGAYTDFYAADESPIAGGFVLYTVNKTLTGLASAKQFYYVVSAFRSGSWTQGTPEQTFTTDAALSVELTAFTAQPAAEGILLKWTTQSECGNAGFTIERRTTDASPWETIASYRTNDRLAGRGNTTGRTDYAYLDLDAQFGGSYTYRISETDMEGTTTVKNEIQAERKKALLPSGTRLDPAFPNPFNPATGIVYHLAEESQVRLSVLDVNGRNVRTLASGARCPAGAYQVSWNATDDSNRPVPNGLYVILLTADDVVQSRKVLLAK